MGEKLIVAIEVRVQKTHSDYRKDVSAVAEARITVPANVGSELTDNITSIARELYYEVYKQLLIGLRNSEVRDSDGQ